jgi:uncharacterized repeat protein (TIGR02543 family)
MVVTLIAMPDAGSGFAGWGGACSGTQATCSVTMDAAKTVTATFTQQQLFTLSVAIDPQSTGAGTLTSSPDGINCGADCTEVYASGTVVTLTEHPTASSVFDGWGGACSGTSGAMSTCSVTMDDAKTATARFKSKLG